MDLDNFGINKIAQEGSFLLFRLNRQASLMNH